MTHAASLLDSSLTEVRRIVLDGLRSHRAKVWLFGSRGAGTGRERSDIDVAVLPLDPLEPGTLARIRESLEESHVPWRVDLVDLTEATDDFRASVERTGIPWTA